MPRSSPLTNFTVSRCALGFAARKTSKRPADRMITGPQETGTPYARARHFGGAIRRDRHRYARRHARARPPMWHKSKTAPRNCARGRRYFAKDIPGQERRFHSSSPSIGKSTLCASRTTCEASSMICVPSFRPACNFRWSTIFPISSRPSVHSLIEHLIFGSILASPGRLAFHSKLACCVDRRRVAIPASYHFHFYSNARHGFFL